MGVYRNISSRTYRLWTRVNDDAFVVCSWPLCGDLGLLYYVLVMCVLVSQRMDVKHLSSCCDTLLIHLSSHPIHVSL